MRTENRSVISCQWPVVSSGVLAELMAMQQEDPVEAKRRFEELSPAELNVLSMELGARLCADLLSAGSAGQVLTARATIESQEAA